MYTVKLPEFSPDSKAPDDAREKPRGVSQQPLLHERFRSVPSPLQTGAAPVPDHRRPYRAPPNFRQERLPCGGSPVDTSPSLDRLWRMGPARGDHRFVRLAARACSRACAAKSRSRHRSSCLAHPSAFNFSFIAMASSTVIGAGTTKYPSLELDVWGSYFAKHFLYSRKARGLPSTTRLRNAMSINSIVDRRRRRPSSVSLPPLEYCRGARPSQAESCRLERNCAPSPIVATSVVAVMTPTPGIAIATASRGSAS